MPNILSTRRKKTVFLAIIACAVAIVPLLQLSSWFQVAELRTYDRLLAFLPDPTVNEHISIVAIDNRSVEAIGEWPWSRSVLADGLGTIALFRPEAVLLDIEFSERSPWVVERSSWEQLRSQFPELMPTELIEDVFLDRDERLAGSIAGVGTVVLPAAVENTDTSAVRYAIPQLREAAAGEGFSNISLDRDGIMRRTDLFLDLGDGTRLWTLGAELLGSGTNERDGIEIQDGRTIQVPRDRDGRMLLRWPRGRVLESYQYVSWLSLLEYQEAVADLVFNLELMRDAGYLDAESGPVLETEAAARETLRRAQAAGSPQLMSEYLRRREAFLSLAAGFLQGGSEDRILEELQGVLGTNAPPNLAAQVEAVQGDVRASFRAGREIYGEIEALSAMLDSRLRDGLVLVGFTATSAVDVGVTPFDNAAPKIGVHAAVISMLTQEDFITPVPWTGAWLGGVALVLGTAFFLRRVSGPAGLLAVVVASVVPVIAVIVIFRFARVYVPLLSLVTPVGLGGVSLLMGEYFAALKEKQAIRTTFEHYLAPEVVEEVVANPDSLKAGGTQSELTALFTDIAAFSRISEILGTGEIVALLNEYLTEMSDVILDHLGTIDKYQGDAIMAFFGAPVGIENHAEQACRAAVRMKKLEPILNDRLMRSGTAPFPLITRIGVNTGEMIVGNLGTKRRLNYTVMGTAVNLASRLEGVNKQYRTSICIGESTYAQLPGGFLMRRMDRVRVTGTDDPVRLYELIGYQDESSAPMREALELFHRGLEEYEQQNWQAAEQRFSTALRVYPNDGPSQVFLQRCREFLATPPRDTWDGVTSLTEK